MDVIKTKRMKSIKEKSEEAKRLYETANVDQRYVLESLFPELKENEDEKIRKELIEYHKAQAFLDGKPNNKHVKYVTWLEKQGEHANFRNKIQIGDKVTRNEDGMLVNLSQLNRVAKKDEKQCEQKPVVSKFKVGDWLVENEPNNYARFIQILEIVNVQGKERYRISRDLHNDEDIVECRFVENNYHPFNIQDAKDGDVLYYKAESGIEYIVMNKGLNEFKNIDSYFRYNSIAGFGVDIPAVLSAKCDSITPATKEQRDLLFAKMKEAGYEWDAEKKKLKRIAQKSADWSEEDEEAINLACSILYSNFNENENFDKDQMCIGEIIEKLKSLKDRYTWKPSDEQMVTLEYYMHTLACNSYKETLFSLYQDLKKLREKSYGRRNSKMSV